ncbi:MAG: hypothetical protein WC841_02045 [Candidatus Shapirobacteria bacterium]|jgi:hypothetical protein
MAEFVRSRLERKEEEQITKKTVLLGFITVVLFVLTITFGLPLLVKFSVFLGDLKNKDAGVDTEKVIPPLAPRIIMPYEATNSSTIAISGLGEIGTVVELLKNDVSIGKVDMTDKGDFVFDDVALENGENSFSAVAMSEKGGSSEMSKMVTVVYDNQPAEIVMMNPSEDVLTVDYSDFDIVGKAEKDASVLVNNRVAMVDDEGKFKLKFQLAAGKNEIEIVARDLAGNETKKKINITYDI